MTHYFAFLCRLLDHRWTKWHPYPEHADIHSRRFCRRCDAIDKRWYHNGPFDPNRERIENSYERPPSCPECGRETRVHPTYAKGGGIVAIVECRYCDYVGEFWPGEGLAEPGGGE